MLALVREGSVEKLEDRIRDQWHTTKRKVKPLVGDLGAPRLGLDKATLDELKGTVDHVIHLAAVYDITADADAQHEANVEGTRHVVQVANRIRAGAPPPRQLHRGRRPVQGHVHRDRCSTRPPASTTRTCRTKHDSEKLARSEAKVPWRVYRPGMVVGVVEDGRDRQDRRPLLRVQADPEAAGHAAAVVPAGRRGGRPAAAGPRRLRGRGDGPHHPPRRRPVGREGLPPRGPRPAAAGRHDEPVRAGRPRPAVPDAHRHAGVEDAAQGRPVDGRSAPAGGQVPPGDPRRPRHPRGDAQVRQLAHHLRLRQHPRGARGQRHQLPAAGGLRLEAVGPLGAPPRPRAVP